MTHLWEIKHSYFCNEGNYFCPINDQPCEEFDSWEDFIEENKNIDFDMNLLFRWDWRKADLDGEQWGNQNDVLLLFWIGQRKGLYRWTTIKIKDDDEIGVKNWLYKRWEHMRLLWQGISE